jgi:hypothetical protein
MKIKEIIINMKKIELKPNTYYWVKNSGYHAEYIPLYFSGHSWKLSIRDKDIFISNYKLELLYGKNCILREINHSTDLLKEDPEISCFFPALVESDSGSDIVFFIHPILRMADHNGMLVPIDKALIKGYLKYENE